MIILPHEVPLCNNPVNPRRCIGIVIKTLEVLRPDKTSRTNFRQNALLTLYKELSVATIASEVNYDVSRLILTGFSNNSMLISHTTCGNEWHLLLNIWRHFSCYNRINWHALPTSTMFVITQYNTWFCIAVPSVCCSRWHNNATYLFQ